MYDVWNVLLLLLWSTTQEDRSPAASTGPPELLSIDLTGAFRTVKDGLPTIWTDLPETPFTSLQRLVDAVRNESKRLTPYTSEEDEREWWGRSVSGFSSDELAFIQCLGGSGNPHSFIDQATRAWSQSFTGGTQEHSSNFSTQINAWRNASYCVRANSTVTPELHRMEQDLGPPQYLPLILTDQYFRQMAPLSTHLEDQLQKCDGDNLDRTKHSIEDPSLVCERSTTKAIEELNKTLDALPRQLHLDFGVAQRAVHNMLDDAAFRDPKCVCFQEEEGETCTAKSCAVYAGEYTFPSFKKGEVRMTFAGTCFDNSPLLIHCALFFKWKLKAFKAKAEEYVKEALDGMSQRLGASVDALRREVKQLSAGLMMQQEAIKSTRSKGPGAWISESGPPRPTDESTSQAYKPTERVTP